MAENKNFQDTVVNLSRSIASYLGIYSDAFNYGSFEDELRGHGRSILRAIFEELFGPKALNSLGAEKIKFLGIGMFDEIEPNQEIEV